MRLYAATSNPGKLRDFEYAAEAQLRDGGHAEIEALPGMAVIEAPAEDEATFEGNARLKAIYYSGFAPGELVVADDSGLEVARAQNFPITPASTLDERNNAALLRALDGVPEHCRMARYRCVLALARDGEVLAMADGTVEGSILKAPRGDAGFGYDPLFLLKEYPQTMAEIEPELRLKVSHRGRALRSLLHGG
jgi:XTP/dITP diphosphohydrolase